MPMQPVEFVDTEQFLTFLKRAIEEDTQWVVFEPNNEALWERVKDQIHLVLRAQWRAGHLKGLTEDEAFTIDCGRSSMTQDDILNGRLICVIGVAPVRPAEFVFLRLLQNTADVQV